MALLALDHVFCMSRPGAPEAAPLWAAGLVAGRQREHAGQGTANTCVFFANAMLEFLWVEDEGEARSDLTAPTGLWSRSRWRETGASPFGICLRTDRDDPAALPFPTRPYAPPYLPDGMVIRLCTELPETAPLLFAIAAPWHPPQHDNAPAHALQDAAVTSCRVRTPAAGAVHAHLRAALPAELSFERAGEHELLLELDSGAAGQRCDLRDRLPLALRW